MPYMQKNVCRRCLFLLSQAGKELQHNAYTLVEYITTVMVVKQVKKPWSGDKCPPTYPPHLPHLICPVALSSLCHAPQLTALVDSVTESRRVSDHGDVKRKHSIRPWPDWMHSDPEVTLHEWLDVPWTLEASKTLSLEFFVCFTFFLCLEKFHERSIAASHIKSTSIWSFFLVNFIGERQINFSPHFCVPGLSPSRI